MQDQLLLEKLLLFQFLLSHYLGTFSMYAEIPENSTLLPNVCKRTNY